MIVLCWQTQPWFPQFVQLVKPETTPLLIPAHQHQLQVPGTNSQHSIWDRLSLVAAILLGLSPDAAQIIRASWRDSTQLAYNTPVQWWLGICNRRQLNPHQPTLSQVLHFLHTLYELGLSYSTIPQLGEHWLVSRFMKEIFHLRPPQPRCTKTWDINKVLSYLKNLGPNDSLSLKQLTLETAALLKILAGRRIYTLYMLSIIHMD